MKKIILLLATGVISFSSSANMITPSHYCTKPNKPYNMDTQYKVNSFLRDVDRYKNCINDFVEQQSRERNNHQKAINNAIDEWNRFVNYELK